MDTEERNKLLHEALFTLVALINTTKTKLAGDMVYIDPEFILDYNKYCLTRPYMTIPFWAGQGGSELKYTLRTNVIGTDAKSSYVYIEVIDSNEENVTALWSDKLSVYHVDHTVGALLFIINRIYHDIRAGITTHSECIDEVNALVDAYDILNKGIQSATRKLMYNESILEGLRGKYKEMLARSALTSNAFKQQEE